MPSDLLPFLDAQHPTSTAAKYFSQQCTAIFSSKNKVSQLSFAKVGMMKAEKSKLKAS